nr:hypothetical protein CFP56_44238 [Quercus suber]
MFCLRSWVPLLIFLYKFVPTLGLCRSLADIVDRTNASPIYVLLFLTATYALQRPCVYCSILLFVLVFSLFDFNADWFEPRWDPSTLNASETLSSFVSGNATITDAIIETASLAVSAINGTGGSLASAAMEGIKKRVGGGGYASESASGSILEWSRGVLEKKQLRIPCVDVLVSTIAPQFAQSKEYCTSFTKAWSSLELFFSLVVRLHCTTPKPDSNGPRTRRATMFASYATHRIFVTAIPSADSPENLTGERGRQSGQSE